MTTADHPTPQTKTTSTTSGPVTYPLDAGKIKLGMTVHYEDGVYKVAAADAAELPDGLVLIQYTDGASARCDHGLQLDVVVHAAMPDSGGYWAILYREQRKQVDQLLVELDQHAAAALANAGHPPEVRAAHAFEANHLAAAVRSVFGLEHPESHVKRNVYDQGPRNKYGSLGEPTS